MNIIVSVDKNNGFMFNHRRQSQDRELVAKVIEISSTAKLLMNEYSAQLFQKAENLIVSEDFLAKAEKGDFCFVEGGKIPFENIEDIYVFNWNRDYPADEFFDFDFKANGYKRVKKTEFVGNSHKKITLEIYKRG